MSAEHVIDEFLGAYRREFDYYQETARIAARLCEQELRGSGKRVIVTHRAKDPERLAEKLMRAAFPLGTPDSRRYKRRQGADTVSRDSAPHRPR